jgi:tetratricopeptide (TPR) repeat protein
MADPKTSLSDEDRKIIEELLQPLNKNPLSSEDLNPMAKVFRQKMGYAEPMQFSDEEEQDSESGFEDSEFGDNPDSGNWEYSEDSNEPAPPEFKSFEDDDIDLDALLAEPGPKGDSDADSGEEPDPFAALDPTEEEEPSSVSRGSSEGSGFEGLDDPFADLGGEDLTASGSDLGAGSDPDFGGTDSGDSSDEDPFAGLGEPKSDDDSFGDFGGGEADRDLGFGGEEPEENEDPFGGLGAGDSGSDDSDGDPFGDLGSGSGASSEDPFGALDAGGGEDPFGGLASAMSEPGDSDPFADLGGTGSGSGPGSEDPFADLGGSSESAVSDDPFSDFGTGMELGSREASPAGDPFADEDLFAGDASPASSLDSEDPFGDMSVDLGAQEQEPTSSLEPSFGNLDEGGFGDLEPPDLDEIGGGMDGVLEDELSSLMDQEAGSVDEGLSDEDLAIIQREIVRYPPKLRRSVIDAIVNNRISVKNQKELIELIKTQQTPEDVADYLASILGEDVPLRDESRPYSADGVPIIATRSIYTKDGALRRRKLIQRTIFATAAAILFVFGAVSLYKYVIIPGRASGYYEEGLTAIRAYAKEKDLNEKRRLLRDAKEFFIKGEEIDPNSLKYLNAYGIEYMKVGRYDESFEMLFGKVDPPFANWSSRTEPPYIGIHPDSRWSDLGVEIAGKIEDPDRPVYLTSQDRVKRRVLKAGAYIVSRVKEDIHDIRTYINLGRFHSFHARDFVEGEKSKNFKNDILAIEYYKRVFTDAGAPDNIDARAGIAKIYYNKKEFPRAASEYNKILEIYPKDPIGHSGLISSYIEIWKRDGNPQFVLNHHRMVKNQLKVEEDLPLFILSKLASFYIDLDPEVTRVRYNVTPEDQVTDMDIDDNAAFLLSLVFNKTEEIDGEKIPGSKYAEGYYQRGRFFVKKDETLRALKQFELAASYDPAHYPAVLKMAEYYMSSADYLEAENLLRNSEQRYLEFRDNYGRRDEDETLVDGDPGKIYFNRGKIIYLQASGILENDVIKEFPGRKIYPNRALVKLPESELERRRGLYTAQEFFRKAQERPHILKNESSIREMIYFEGWTEYMLGNFGSAIQKWSELGEEDLYFNSTLILGMGNSSYYTNQLNSALANYMKVMEDYEAKEALIKRVVYEDQDHQEIYQILVAVYNNIGAVYERKGDMVQALNFYWKAIETARKIELVSEIANSNKDLLMKKERLGQQPLLEDWLSPTLDKLRTLLK